MQAAVVAAWHQQECARQEAAGRRGGELDRIPGAADAGQARKRMSLAFSGKHVVVTGGTGALGTAVVGGLLAAGATCTVPYVHEAEAQRFPHRGDAKVKLIAVADLADAALVAKVYDGLNLWASIHIAGGFAPGKVAETGQTALMAQINGNLVSCFLCCRAAVNAMAAGGRIVNVGRGRRWNGVTEPAWQPIWLRKRASPRSPWR